MSPDSLVFHTVESVKFTFNSNCIKTSSPDIKIMLEFIYSTLVTFFTCNLPGQPRGQVSTLEKTGTPTTRVGLYRLYTYHIRLSRVALALPIPVQDHKAYQKQPPLFLFLSLSKPPRFTIPKEQHGCHSKNKDR